MNSSIVSGGIWFPGVALAKRVGFLGLLTLTIILGLPTAGCGRTKSHEKFDSMNAVDAVDVEDREEPGDVNSSDARTESGPADTAGDSTEAETTDTPSDRTDTGFTGVPVDVSDGPADGACGPLVGVCDYVYLTVRGVNFCVDAQPQPFCYQGQWLCSGQPPTLNPRQCDCTGPPPPDSSSVNCLCSHGGCSDGGGD